MGRTEQAVVIGAGVSGLTTAVCLADLGWAVQVWAAEPPRRTTSAVAGALWGPSFQEPTASTTAWTDRSRVDFLALAGNPATGVRMVPSLTVGTMPVGAEPPPQVRLIPDLRPVGADEVPDGFAGGFRARMPLVDMPKYLDYLLARLVASNIRV